MFNGVVMDIIQMKVMIVLVADDMVPESLLPDRTIAPEVGGLFISMGKEEFDGLHEIRNGWNGFDRNPWCQVASAGRNLTYGVRAKTQ